MKAVKFLWKRKHFKERSWKREQTRKRQLYTEMEAEAKNILLAFLGGGAAFFQPIRAF